MRQVIFPAYVAGLGSIVKSYLLFGRHTLKISCVPFIRCNDPSNLIYRIPYGLSLVVGSPNNIQVRRTSLFLEAAFARAVASPRVNGLPESNSRLNNSRSIGAWSPGPVIPEEAQTAIAPPCCDFISD